MTRELLTVSPPQPSEAAIPDHPFASAPGGPITRSEVLARAQWWVSAGVHYLAHDGNRPAIAPDPHGRPYRTDCSGYVCMAWHASTEPSTAEFAELGDPVPMEQLRAGDALLWGGEGGYGENGGHVLLFADWAGPDRYVGYELSGGRAARRLVLPYPYRGGDSRYLPWRYRGVLEA